MKMLLALLIVAIGFVMVQADGHFGDDDRLEMALKTLLQGEEELNLESRDTRRGCMRATNNCNQHGDCVQDMRGDWYCKCEPPYTVGGSESSCYLFDAKTKDLEMEARDTLTRCQTDTKNCDGHGSCQQSTFGRSYGHYICFCDSGYRGNSYGGCTAYNPREVMYLSNLARDVELELLTRDTLARCNQDTKNCDGFGECVKSTFGRSSGQFICRCNDGYRNNLYGGCSPRTKREMEYLTMIARNQELEMQARDTLAQCKRDTNDCDGFGECVQSQFGRSSGQFICRCNDGYENNLYGGCSPKITRDTEFDIADIADPNEDRSKEEEENDDREFQLDLLRRLANIFKE